eukprot:364347-Chlamydomonas_euryale.AAC.16
MWHMVREPSPSRGRQQRLWLFVEGGDGGQGEWRPGMGLSGAPAESMACSMAAGTTLSMHGAKPSCGKAGIAPNTHAAEPAWGRICMKLSR